MSGYTHRYNVNNFSADVAAAVNAPPNQRNVNSRKRKERIAVITNEFGDPNTWEAAPTNIANRAEMARVRATQEEAARMISTPPPLPKGPRPSVPKSPVSIPPVPKRSLPKITANQQNYINKHPSLSLGIPQPTRPLPPLPVEGARRKTRRTRKNKTRKTRSNRR